MASLIFQRAIPRSYCWMALSLSPSRARLAALEQVDGFLKPSLSRIGARNDQFVFPQVERRALRQERVKVIPHLSIATSAQTRIRSQLELRF